MSERNSHGKSQTGGYEVPAGDALFALSGSAMGASSIIYAPNLRPIYFRRRA